MTRPHALLAVILTLALVLGACSPAAAPTPAEGLAATLAMRTMVAERGMNLFATPTPQPTSKPTLPPSGQLESQPTPSQAPIATSANKQTLYAAAEPGDCDNKAEFIRDITIPDDTTLLPGEKFTKVWQFRNAGNCTWKNSYALTFLWGELMSGANPRLLDFEVQPGQTGNIALELVAPTFPDYYQGHWIFTDDEGHQFGTGENGKNYFWVSIIVGVPGFGGSIFSPICKGGG